MIDELYKMLLLNECGGDKALAYMFSDADGVRTGRSGYSFGVSQFDIENNWHALLILRRCGFKPKELKELFNQSTNVSHLDKKLQQHSRIIDVADRQHIRQSLLHVQALFPNETDITVAMLVDYHNQLTLTPEGKLHTYLKTQQNITPEVILGFKLHNTAWGKKRPDDVKRRYRNLLEVFKQCAF